MYYEYQSPFPPFPILLLEATALGMVLILAILLVEPLLQKLYDRWLETVDRWWVKRQAEREGAVSAGTREGVTLVDHQGLVVELRHRVTALEAKVAEAEAREVIRVAHLEEILDIAHEHGGEDGGDSGVTCVGCQRILALADSALALSSPSPSAQALTRLVEAATSPRLREQVNQLRITFPMDPESGPNTPDDLEDFEALGDLLEAGDALQAARSGRGEGEA